MIGIYGPWGDGKTSVLNMMSQALASEEDVICIPFNPWHFESEDQLIRGFFNSLAAAIGKKLTTAKEDIGKFLHQYRWLSIGGVFWRWRSRCRRENVFG